MLGPEEAKAVLKASPVLSAARLLGEDRLAAYAVGFQDSINDFVEVGKFG